MWTFEHHAGYRPYLWHNLSADHVIDAAVVIVLGTAAPNAQLCKRLAVEELGGKDACSSYFGRIIVLQDVLHLLIIVCLGSRLCIVGSSHRCDSFLVVVHAVVLRLSTLAKAD